MCVCVCVVLFKSNSLLFIHFFFFLLMELILKFCLCFIPWHLLLVYILYQETNRVFLHSLSQVRYSSKFPHCSHWGCRIHRLLLCRGVRPPPNKCPGYDTKQSDGEVPAVLELWGMWSTPSWPLLPGPLWPGVVAPDRALPMG